MLPAGSHILEEGPQDCSRRERHYRMIEPEVFFEQVRGDEVVGELLIGKPNPFDSCISGSMELVFRKDAFEEQLAKQGACKALCRKAFISECFRFLVRQPPRLPVS